MGFRTNSGEWQVIGSQNDLYHSATEAPDMHDYIQSRSYLIICNVFRLVMPRKGRGRNNRNMPRGGFQRYQRIVLGVIIILVYVMYKSFQDDSTSMRIDSTHVPLVEGEWRAGIAKISKPSDRLLHDNQTELNSSQQGASLDRRYGSDTNKDIDINRYHLAKNTSALGEDNSIKLNGNQTYIEGSNRAVISTLTAQYVRSTSLERTETRNGTGVNRTNIQMVKTTGVERTSGELLKKRGKSSEYVTDFDWESKTDRAKLEGFASHALKLANFAQHILTKINASLSTQRNLYIGNKTQLIKDFVVNAQNVSQAAKDVLARIKYHEAKDMDPKMNDTTLEGFAVEAKAFAKYANAMITNTNFSLSDEKQSEDEVNKTKSYEDFVVEAQKFAKYANDLFIDRSVGLTDTHAMIRNTKRQGVIDKTTNITDMGMNVIDKQTLKNISSGGVLEKFKINTGTLQ